MDRRSTLSPFGGLLDEIREERVNRAPSARTAAPATAEAADALVAPVAHLRDDPAASGRPEPELHLEAGVVSGLRAADAGRPWRWATSLAIHGGFVVAVVTLPLLIAEELPTPSSLSRVLFIQPALAPPPPPPPAPRMAAAPSSRREAPVPKPSALAAPAQVPVAIKPEEVAEPSPPRLERATVDDGVPGGVDEGVPGGIVGGVIDRASTVDPPAPSHIRVGGAIKEPRKVKSVEPVYPDVAARGKIEGVVILELAIKPNGRVEDVHVLRSIPLLDSAAVDAARQWVFTPTLVGGVPVGVTMTVSVRFSLGTV
jgi:protein TonB